MFRKPDGMIAGRATAGGGVPAQVPYPGVYVLTRAELSLYASCFMAKHYQCTRRTLAAAGLTVDNVQHYNQYKEADVMYKKAEELITLTKIDKIIDFINEWPEKLAMFKIR
jgi:hypothetical protein